MDRRFENPSSVISHRGRSIQHCLQGGHGDPQARAFGLGEERL
jgi:hypothetical protein